MKGRLDKHLAMAKTSRESNESEIGPTERKELKSLLATLSGRLDEFKENVASVVEVFGEMRDAEGDDVVDYLRVKQQLLLSYVTNLVFYVQLKLKGEELSRSSRHKCPCGTQVCY